MSIFGNKGPAGGLSINTAAANTAAPASTQPPPSGGLFGQPKPGGSLFGATTSASSAGTLFGPSANPPATQQSSLFGNTATAPSSAGTLFGGAAASNTGGSLFGNRPAASTQPTATSLFGSTLGSTPQPQQQQSQQQQQPQTSSLFGSTGPSQPQQTRPSLFGGTQPQQQPQQQQQSSLFGGASTQQQPQQQQSLFGASNPQQQQQQQQQSSIFGQTQGQGSQGQGSLFGAPNAQGQAGQPSFGYARVSTLGPSQQPQRSIFSASIGQYTQAAQTVPGVRVDMSSVKPTTRFEDLTEEAQRIVAACDDAFQAEMAHGDDCAVLLPQAMDAGSAIAPDVAFLEDKLDAVRAALLADAAAIDEAKRLTHADAADAARFFRVIKALRVPAPLSARASLRDYDSAVAELADGPAAAENKSLVGYFSTRSDELAARLGGLKETLAQVERYIGEAEAQTVEQAQTLRMGRGLDGSGSGGPRSRDDRLRELVGVLREFERAIVAVAGNVSRAREAVDEAKNASAARLRPGARY